MTTIPADEIVAMNPSVLGAGGSALDITALMLTTSTRVPVGSVASFPDPDSVSNYFGPASAELAAATIYFNGYDGSSKLPGAVLFAQYNPGAVAAYLRGGDASTVPLTAIQAADGQLLITVNGTLITIADVDLSSATSLSNAASILQTAIQAGANPDATCVYDSISGAFIITSPTAGAASTITFVSGTGTVGTVLKLTAATGAVLSQGADAAVPATLMNALVAVTANWVNFMNVQDPDAPGVNTNKLAFANWVGTKKNRFAYVAWDADPTPAAQLPATASLGDILTANKNSGTCLNWGPDNTKAAFVCGAAASIDFEELGGRITFAFKSQAGLVADVTTAAAANNLGGSPQGASRGNGYNFYGAYGAANQDFVWYQRGFVTGQFAWFDSFINQVWMDNSFQIGLLNLFNASRSIPFTPPGNSKIESAMQDTIDAGLRFGAFAPGDITASQKAQVNAAAGINISDTLQAQGYYVQITTASGAVRSARGPLGIKFWYLDRGSVQSISLDSIALQ